MLYVLSYSVGQSRAAGLASAVGLGLGGAILAVATALGLATIFAATTWAEIALRYLGSAYLVWLGLGMIRDAAAPRRAQLALDPVAHQPLGRIVWRGIVVEVLNPKTILFFALFLPPFISRQDGASVPLQLLVLGILVPLTAVPCDLFVAWMGGTIRRTLSRRSASRAVLAWIGGLTLIAIALNLHLQVI